MTSRHVPTPVESEQVLPASADVPEIQAALRRDLQARVRPELFESWLAEVELVDREGARFVFQTPSPFVRDWVRRNFLSELQTSLEAVVGRRDVHVVLRSGSRTPGPATLGVVDVASRGPAVAGQGAYEEAAVDRAGADPLEVEARAGREGGDADTVGAGENLEGDGALSGHGGEHRMELDQVNPSIDRGTSPRPDAAMSSDTGASAGAGDPSGAGEAGAAAQPVLRPDHRAASDRDPARPGSTPGAGAVERVPGGQVFGGQNVGGQGAELNRNYTFDTFVVGPCNRLSHAAALAVGDNPGRAYNPFFVHGNVGLGKTHVLQAVCHSIRRRNEDAQVLYLSCEDFTNRFIHSIQRGELDKFREIHRGVDVLVIDDIQFLENKEKTQDEFFHTFNALYNTNRQIILSSDRPPSDIPTIEERLVSRFKWGLVAEMEVPCFETRVAIVKRKARLRQEEMPDEVAWFIAERIDTNIRELEGAVIKVVGIASITERPLSVELAEEALKGVVVSRTRKLSLGDVMGVVTGHFSVSARELTGKGRTQAVSLPRQICMYLCRQHTEQSLEEIGRFFGNRDHTTVIYAVQKIKKRVKEDRVFRELVGTLSSRLSS